MDIYENGQMVVDAFEKPIDMICFEQTVRRVLGLESEEKQ